MKCPLRVQLDIGVGHGKQPVAGAAPMSFKGFIPHAAGCYFLSDESRLGTTVSARTSQRRSSQQWCRRPKIAGGAMSPTNRAKQDTYLMVGILALMLFITGTRLPSTPMGLVTTGPLVVTLLFAAYDRWPTAPMWPARPRQVFRMRRR
jgi:hypothetical protein